MIVTVVVVSSSGVLSPGPLFFTNMIYAKRYGYNAGIFIAHGHAIIEFPLVILIALSIISTDIVREYKWIISIVGGVALLVFVSMQGIQIARGKRIDYDDSSKVEDIRSRYRLVIVGILFSALNPFFISWWLTIGTKIITDALMLAGLYGILLIFITHIWMDYAWLTVTASLTSKGISILGRMHYRILMLALSSLLVYIAIIFILEGINLL